MMRTAIKCFNPRPGHATGATQGDLAGKQNQRGGWSKSHPAEIEC
jgi:hypothetical protein